MADETYRPRGSHPDPSGLVERRLFSGPGAPTSTAGVPPNGIYIDEDSGDVYQLEDGAWVLQYSGGGGGSGGALPTSGDPEGVLTADNLQFAWDASANVLYIHEGADGTNTGWRELIA